MIYARKANSQLWSSVLDAGGYDVLTEPFSSEELQEAVLNARKRF